MRSEQIKLGKENWNDHLNYKGNSSKGGDLYVTVHYNDDGTIDKKRTYTKEYLKKLEEEEDGTNKKEKKKKDTTGRKKDGCLAKIIKAPFKLLWWLIKIVLKILTFGLIASILDDDKK